MRTVLAVAFVAIASAHLHGQAFEVASIKPSAPQPAGHTDSRMSTNNGRLNYTAVTLKDVLEKAYKVEGYQITGPDWIDVDRFDIAATTPAGASRDQYPQMLQALLAERFHLTIRRETKELPVFELNVAKNGPKLKSIESESGITSNSNRSGWHVVAKGSLQQLVEFLSERVNRPVLDRTGLSGPFEITLDWASDDSLEGPSLFTALQEQAGLKLSATRAPIELIVVDQADRTPTAN